MDHSSLQCCFSSASFWCECLCSGQSTASRLDLGLGCEWAPPKGGFSSQKPFCGTFILMFRVIVLLHPLDGGPAAAKPSAPCSVCVCVVSWFHLEPAALYWKLALWMNSTFLLTSRTALDHHLISHQVKERSVWPTFLYLQFNDRRFVRWAAF